MKNQYPHRQLPFVCIPSYLPKCHAEHLLMHCFPIKCSTRAIFSYLPQVPLWTSTFHKLTLFERWNRETTLSVQSKTLTYFDTITVHRCTQPRSLVWQCMQKMYPSLSPLTEWIKNSFSFSAMIMLFFHVALIRTQWVCNEKVIQENKWSFSFFSSFNIHASISMHKYPLI